MAIAPRRRHTRRAHPAFFATSPKAWCYGSRSSSDSDDAARAVSPIAVAQQALVELARRQARQLVLEVDRARNFLARKMLCAICEQLVDDGLAAFDSRHELDDRFHFLAQVFVGHAEHSGVGD